MPTVLWMNCTGSGGQPTSGLALKKASTVFGSTVMVSRAVADPQVFVAESTTGYCTIRLSVVYRCCREGAWVKLLSPSPKDQL